MNESKTSTVRSGKGMSIVALVISIIACCTAGVALLGIVDVDHRMRRVYGSKSGSDFETTWKLIALESKLDQYNSVTLDPSIPKQYARVNSSSGFFLVSLQDVEPYLDGVKVWLNIGNPLSATYGGFKIKAKWGPKWNPAPVKANPNYYKEWKSALREKELSFTDSLESGRWNSVELILSPATPEDFGHLELAIETDTVSLHRMPNSLK